MQRWLKKLFSDECREIDPVTECWLFKGYIDPKGRGRYCSIEVHKLAVLEFGDCNGNDVEGGYDSQIHHKCQVPRCFNPKHLQVMTPEEHKAEHSRLRMLG